MMRLLVVLALLAAPAAAAPPKAVADIPAVHALAAQVMGDLGAPVLLIDQGGDPHSFQLRPSQARALAEADLLFWVGPELTPWLARALEGTGIAGEAVALLHAEGTRARVFDEDHGHGAEEAHGEEHGAGALDPHAWLDPANATAWLGLIAARLEAADPENAAAYAANAEAAQAGIAALDAELGERLAGAAGRPLYVYHDAYGYFAEAFGLTIAGTLAAGDAADPGAARMRALRDELAAAEGACVFAEAGHDPALMANLAEGTGLRIGTLDPSGLTLEPGPGLYAALLRGLAEAIAGCSG
jgi:zinc transport system substrate-binding protein